MAAGIDGWVAEDHGWTYSSEDAPTYIIRIPYDVTAFIGVGYRIKLTQNGTVKYFIVTAVGSYSSGATLVTVYGGTDYTLLDLTNFEDAIVNPMWSNAKAPFGFPVSPIKWTVTTSDAVGGSKSSPVAGTWYNASSFTVPIGLWTLKYKLDGTVDTNVINIRTSFFVTLSTANNSETDAEFTQGTEIQTVKDFISPTFSASKVVSITVKTIYYLNMSTSVANIADINTSVLNPTVLTAVCAYL